jgi:uncharacterized protein (UPF0332 family)
MNRTMVLAEWQRAVQALRAPELLAGAGYPADALSRAYYATLHAAKAALYVHDVAAASHAAVRRLFGLHLIRTGEIEGVWASQQARAFLDRIRHYLLTTDVSANALDL